MTRITGDTLPGAMFRFEQEERSPDGPVDAIDGIGDPASGCSAYLYGPHALDFVYADALVILHGGKVQAIIREPVVDGVGWKTFLAICEWWRMEHNVTGTPVPQMRW